MIDIKSFKDIVVNYKIVFFDAFGVLKNYQGMIPGVDQTLEFLKRNEIDYYILTNDASRSPLELAKTYQDAGIKDITSGRIISSGMLAREYLGYKFKGGIVAYLGTENSAHYIESLGIQTISIDKVDLNNLDAISALVLLDDEGFDWNKDLNKTINLIRYKNMPIIVANTDEAYPTSRREIAVAIGGIADMLEAIVGKRFMRFGKPDAQMYIFAYEHVQKTKQFGKQDVLMVGDTLQTDIIGGNKFGVDTCLVLSGNTMAEHLSSRIHSTGIIPDYICESAAIDDF